jgi:hypothetical protein
MKSLFTGLVAAVLALSFGGALLAQQAELSSDPAFKKAMETRAKQLEAVAKGERRAVEAEGKLKAQTAAMTPNIIAQSKISCTVTDSANRASWNNNNVVELACAEGIGYIAYVGPNGANVQALECIPNPRSPLPTACTLPANTPPHKALQAYVTRSGSNCQVANANLLAASPKLSAYEIACASGEGQLLTIDFPRTEASRTVTQPCLAVAVMLPGVKCTLTTDEANAAPVRALAAKSDRACPVKDQRYVGSGASGAEYYEIACQDNTGFMILANDKGEIQRTIACFQASAIAGGCKLTDATAAMANQNATYTQLLKTAGLDCEVSKFAPFPPKAGSTAEAVEVACANRPESVVALINGGKADVMNCARARVDGFGCTYTKPEDAYKLLTADLKTTRFQTCEVSGHRAMGTSSRNAFVEVACSDGNPGFVLTYPLGSGKPSEATPCGMANNLGGGCQLPANKRS